MSSRRQDDPAVSSYDHQTEFVTVDRQDFTCTICASRRSRSRPAPTCCAFEAQGSPAASAHASQMPPSSGGQVARQIVLEAFPVDEVEYCGRSVGWVPKT